MKINLGKREVEAVIYALDLYVDSGDPSGSKMEKTAGRVLDKIIAKRNAAIRSKDADGKEE